MKTRIKRALALLVVILIFQYASADSPITSTNFYTAYENNKMVKYAANKGIIDKKISKYLLSAKVSIDIKAAVINALSWDINGKNNSILLIDFMTKKYKKTSDEILLDDLTADELFCLGYLRVMDDYFNPAEALELLDLARQKKPVSYTINICADRITDTTR